MSKRKATGGPVSLNNGQSRVLDLDDDGATEVRLGGKTFWIRQQRRAILEQVIKAVYAPKVHQLPEEIDAEPSP